MSSLFEPAETAEKPEHVLGAGRNSWAIAHGQVDLSTTPTPPLIAMIEAEPLSIEVDLRRSAVIVVDMQNNFCAPGGLVDHLGGDLAPERAPIAPLAAT